MAEFKFFVPLDPMLGEPCCECGAPVTKNDVLVQENVPCGGNALFCRKCFDAPVVHPQIETEGVLKK